MRRDKGKPVVGSQFGMLGARVPRDIEADADGSVHPDRRGMSVYQALTDFLPHMLPPRFASIIPGAAGRGTDDIWRRGEGEFVDGPFAPLLTLRVDEEGPSRSRHGCVIPERVMPLSDYQNALAATRDEWEIYQP
jgi:hypothetical protein